MKTAQLQLRGQDCGLTVQGTTGSTDAAADCTETPKVLPNVPSDRRPQSLPISRAPPNRPYRDRAVEFDHFARSRERIGHTAYVRMPHASSEVEIVGTVPAFAGSRPATTGKMPDRLPQRKHIKRISEQAPWPILGPDSNWAAGLRRLLGHRPLDHSQ